MSATSCATTSLKIRRLAGPADSMDAIERVRGRGDELAARGLVALEPMVGDWSPASGCEFGTTLAATSG